MIDLEQYKKVLDSGLLLDHYLILCQLRDGKEPAKTRRVTGFINLLNKKGYIEDGILTEKALDLVHMVIPISTTTTTTMQPVSVKANADFAKWVSNLHNRCQNKLLELTGKKQVRDRIDKTVYSFLPNPTDLGRVLLRVITAYRLDDYDKIEKCIISYIIQCHQARNWFPLLQYYIMKDNTSRLVTDMQSEEENSNNNEDKSTQTFV